MDVMTVQQTHGKSLPSELRFGGRNGFQRLMGNGEVVQQRGIRGLGMTAEEWAAILKSTSEATLPLIIAQNPGTMYTTDPRTGAITVYAQPTGSMQNLPVGVISGGGGYGGSGSIQTPMGSATFGGIDTSTLLLVGVVGLAVFMMMGQRGR